MIYLFYTTHNISSKYIISCKNISTFNINFFIYQLSFLRRSNVDLFLETAILKRLSEEVSILYSLKQLSQQIYCFIVYIYIYIDFN